MDFIYAIKVFSKDGTLKNSYGFNNEKQYKNKLKELAQNGAKITKSDEHSTTLTV